MTKTRTINWTKRGSGQEDTTGWSEGLISTYVCLLAIASNERWQETLRNDPFSFVEFEKTVSEVNQIIFGNSKIDYHEPVEAAHRALLDNKFRELKFNDSVIGHPDVSRIFRASQVLRSVVVHSGAAEFTFAKAKSNESSEILFPTDLKVKFHEQWMNYVEKQFSDLPSILKTKIGFNELRIHFADNDYELFKLSGNGGLESDATKGTMTNPKQKHFGPGQYLLLYGPPGTGKTRAANRLILDRVSKQIVISSHGSITQTDLEGEWTDEKRPLILKELRKFVTACQFHASYSYEDFIEGLRPIRSQSGALNYEIMDGAFLTIWRKALGEPIALASSCKSDGDGLFDRTKRRIR